MKKFIALLLVVLFSFTVFAGCTNNQDSNNNQDNNQQNEENQDNTSNANNNENSKEEKVTLKFWRPGTDENFENYWNNAMERYKSDNPNIEFELTSLPWGNEMETKLNTGYASGTGPDVLAYSVASIVQRAELGQYYALDSYIENWENKDDIYENVLKIGTHNEKVYGLGFNADPRIFIWRKDYFEEVGLDPEQPPETWEELAEYARELVKKDGDVTVRGGFDVPVGNGYQLLQIFGNQNGGKTMDTVNHEPLFDSPEFIEAAEFLTGLVEEGLNVPWDQHSGLDPIRQGTVAMAYGNPNLITQMISEDPTMEDKLGAAPPLKKETRGTFCGFQLMFISTDTEYKDESWDYIEFLFSKDEMWTRLEEAGSTPVFNSLEEDYIELDPELNKAILGAIQVGEAVPKVTYATEVMDAMSLAMEKAYYGEMSAEEALKSEANKLREKIPELIGE